MFSHFLDTLIYAHLLEKEDLTYRSPANEAYIDVSKNEKPRWNIGIQGK